MDILYWLSYDKIQTEFDKIAFNVNTELYFKNILIYNLLT